VSWRKAPVSRRMVSQHGTQKSENPRHEPGDAGHPGIDRLHGGH